MISAIWNLTPLPAHPAVSGCVRPHILPEWEQAEVPQRMWLQQTADRVLLAARQAEMLSEPMAQAVQLLTERPQATEQVQAQRQAAQQ